MQFDYNSVTTVILCALQYKNLSKSRRFRTFYALLHFVNNLFIFILFICTILRYILTQYQKSCQNVNFVIFLLIFCTFPKFYGLRNRFFYLSFGNLCVQVYNKDTSCVQALSENKENDEYFAKARAIRGKNTQESFRIPSGFNEEAIRICRNSQNFRLFRYALFYIK